MFKGDICIIGLGRFGQSVLKTLSRMGKEVIVIDEDSARVNKFGGGASFAACLDSTDEQALLEIGIDKMETVVVAIGSDIEASIITTAILVDLGIKDIIAKATSERHASILNKIGVTNIIRPEIDAGRKAAERAIYGHAIDTTSINHYNSLIRTKVFSEDLLNKPLKELHFRHKYGFSIVSIIRDGVLIIPNGDEQLSKGDEVTIIGENEAISKIQQLFGIDKEVKSKAKKKK